MPVEGPQHRYETPFGELNLCRYPGRAKEPLLPWCSADTLLLEAMAQGGQNAAATLVVNDEHGALSLSLSAMALWTDSWMSARAMRENATRNGLDAVPVVWSTESPAVEASVAVVRAPKHLPYFEDQLSRLAEVLPEGALVLVAGMDKHLSPRTAELMEKHLGPTERHRGRAHARLFSAVNEKLSSPGVHNTTRYHCDPLGLELEAAANVFSADKLDGGSRFLMEHLRKLPSVACVVDLACGNGVLGLAALRQGLANRLLACDESAMAIESARKNLSQHAPGFPIDYHHGDGLLGLDKGGDLILCNPPFHLQHTVDEFAGRRLLSQAARYLPPDGTLCLVANRHLKYQSTLRREFASVELLAENRRFRIWLAQTG